MVLPRPIPLWLLGDTMLVRVPNGRNGFADPVEVSRVRFECEQSVADDAHRSADAGAGKVFVDAVNSVGAFEVPAGSRVAIRGHSYYVSECHPCEDFFGRVHHWELEVS